MQSSLVPFDLVASRLLVPFPKTTRLSFFFCLKRHLHSKISANRMYLSYLEKAQTFSSTLLKKKEPILSDFDQLEAFFSVGISVYDCQMNELRAAGPGYEENMRVMAIQNGGHYCLIKNPKPKGLTWICEKCGFETGSGKLRLRHETRKTSCQKKKNGDSVLSQVVSIS